MTAYLSLLPAFDTSEGPVMPDPARCCSGAALFRDGKPYLRVCRCHFGNLVDNRPALRLVRPR